MVKELSFDTQPFVILSQGSPRDTTRVRETNYYSETERLISGYKVTLCYRLSIFSMDILRESTFKVVPQGIEISRLYFNRVKTFG